MGLEFYSNLKGMFDGISDQLFSYGKRKKATLVIPAFNEEKSIKNAIRAGKASNFVDEIIVVDDYSTDKTYDIAKSEKVTVIRHETNKGKGKAIKTGIQNATNEVICFIDADIPEWKGSMISKIIRPVAFSEAEFVKTSFSRDSGRVTILTAKPLLRLFFPGINLDQPLSGQFCATKEFLSKIRIEDRYGIDIGIVIDAQRKGLKMQEVFLGKITNKSKSLADLGPMAEQVAETIAKKAKVIPSKYPLVVFCLEKSAEKKQKYLKETIRRLQIRNHEIMLIGSKPTDEMIHLMDKTQVRTVFMRDKNKKKEIEKLFQLLCESYSIKPKKVLFIGEGSYCKKVMKESGLGIITKNSSKELNTKEKIKITSWPELLVLAK